MEAVGDEAERVGPDPVHLIITVIVTIVVIMSCYHQLHEGKGQVEHEEAEEVPGVGVGHDEADPSHNLATV